MPRSTRTSPKHSAKPLLEVQSEPDLTGLNDSSLSVNTRKRMRVEDSCCDATQLEQLKSTIMSWKADQDTILKQLVADVAELKKQNQSIKDSNAEIVKSMHFMNANYEDMNKKMQDFEREKKNLHDCILGLEKKIQDFQFMSRNSSVEIRNIPAKDNESITDLTNVVTLISTSLNVGISPNDLRDVYRLPGKKGINRSIVAQFSTVNKKSTFLKSIVNYNKQRNTAEKLNTEIIGIPGNRQPVYVAEYLPPSLRRIFYLARNYAKENSYKFCWVSNGNIFIRKEAGDRQILIKSEQCLLKVNTQQ